MENLLFRKRKKKKNKGADLAVALIIGAAAGAVVALLLAPESGDKTLAKLKKQAIKLNGDIQELAAEIGVKGREWAGKTSEEMEVLKGNLKGKAAEYRQRVNS